MRAMRGLRLRTAALLVVLGICLWSLSALAGEAFVLRLGTEGSATVVLSRESFTAFLTDGGRKSGLVGASIDGQSVGEMLKKAKIKHLVVTCSHPHDDHLGGLVEFLTSDAVADLALKRVDFVESGFGDDSLYSIYEKHWKDKPRRPPVSRSHTADSKNAFATISFERAMTVEVENLVYTPKGKAGAHGRSVVTIYELKSGEQTTRLVDFDDADTDVVKQFIDWVRADNNSKLQERRPHVVIMPHHGTSLELTDVTGLFAEDIRPRDVIFTVNEENRYLHPHPKTVTYCLGELTPEHVHFTAGSSNVVITEKGVQRPEATTSLSAFARAIRPKLDRIDTRLSQLRELSAIRELTADQQRYFDRHDSWLRAMYEVLRRFDDPDIGEMGLAESPKDPKGPTFPANTGSYSQLVRESRVLDREQDRTAPAPGGGGGGGGAPGRPAPSRPVVASNPTPRSSSGGGGARGGGGGGGGGFRGGSPRFQRMFRAAPVFGGVMLGNQYDAGGLKVQSATIRLEADDEGISNPVIAMVVKGVDDKQHNLIYDNVTATELWCALRFVDPSEVNREFGLELDEEDCGLVGITRNDRGHEAWFFGIHPAISNTMLSQDAMRLDMVLESEFRPEVIDDFPFQNYQWYDEAAIFQAEAGRVVVSPHNEPSDSLLRLRLWGPGKEYENPELEIARQVKEGAEKLGLGREAACIVALWPLEESSLDERIVAKEIAGENAEDLEALIEEGPQGYYKRSKVAGTPAAFLIEAEQESMLSALKASFALEQKPKTLFPLIEREMSALAKNGPKGFETSTAFQLWKITAPLKYDRTNASVSRKTIREAVAKAGLDKSADFKIWELQQDATEQILADLQPRNIEFDNADVINELKGDFAPLRRLDRFARAVALVRWIKDDTGALPTCAGGVTITPARMNVPPVFFFRDVWEQDALLEE